ncbi:MAG TPA: hypothetical protein VEZ11_04640 [Thermoanaerobaculia bacterium]|nr:hypothetical protein [Thermoanaerobaculia bacterium]
MHAVPVTILLLVSLSAAPAGFAAEPAKTHTFTFENDTVGAPPTDFELARTGGGAEGKWTVQIERGGKNRALLQSSADKTGRKRTR